MVADNAIDIHPDSLAALHETVSDVLTGIVAPNTPTLMDRLPVGEGGALTQQFAHKGVIFSFLRPLLMLRVIVIWCVWPKSYA